MGAAWRRGQLAFKKARNRSGIFDHVMASFDHYGKVNGGGQAGAITYYAFLAFFPIMALAFFAVGQIATVYPDARDSLVDIVNTLFEGLIGDGEGQVRLEDIQGNAGRVGLLGLLGFLYAGLGWMSALRNSLQVVFDKPQKDRPNIFVGKARDLMTFGIVGLMLLVAFALTTIVSRYDDETLELVGLNPDAFLAAYGLRLFGVLLAIVVITSLLMVLYQLLARPRVSHRALREGSVLAAVGFVLLKLVADQLIELTHGQPAFTVFGVALVLLVLINYFSRVVMFGAAWAYTSKRAPDLFEDDESGGPHSRSPRS